MIKLPNCERLDFFDAPLMGLAIFIPATSISILCAILVCGKFGQVAAVIFAGIVFLLFMHFRRKTLVSVSIASDVVELITIGGVHSFRAEEIKSCVVFGVRPALTFFVVIRIAGRRFPAFFQAGASVTNVGGYRESISRIKAMLQS